jgi:hypothetical protein
VSAVRIGFARVQQSCGKDADRKMCLKDRVSNQRCKFLVFMPDAGVLKYQTVDTLLSGMSS